MNNLLTKTLFISLLLSAAISSDIQAPLSEKSKNIAVAAAQLTVILAIGAKTLMKTNSKIFKGILLVTATVEGVKVGYGELVGAIIRWSIWIFAILAILYQLGVVRPMVQTLFSGIIAFFVISFGIAFGLGGKDVASEILRDVKNKLKSD